MDWDFQEIRKKKNREVSALTRNFLRSVVKSQADRKTLRTKISQKMGETKDLNKIDFYLSQDLESLPYLLRSVLSLTFLKTPQDIKLAIRKLKEKERKVKR